MAVSAAVRAVISASVPIEMRSQSDRPGVPKWRTRIPAVRSRAATSAAG